MSHMSNVKREARVTVPLAGQTYTAEDGTISYVMEDSINENYEPSQEEIEQFAQWMGMSLPEDADLLWIAKEGLKTPLPKEWKPCRTDKGEVYYFNFKTGESSWEHPMDELFRTKFEQEKARQTKEQQQRHKIANGSISQNAQNMQKTNANTKEIALHTTNSIKKEQITNGVNNKRNTFISNNDVKLSSWHSPRVEMSIISSSPNVSSVIADSSLSFEKMDKNAMHHTLSSDTETTRYDQSDSTSLSFMAPGKNSVVQSSTLHSFGTVPHHLSNTLSSGSNNNNNNINIKTNNLPAPMSPVYTSPFSTPIASTKGLLLLSTPTSNNVNNAMDNETHTTSTRIVSEAEKALETRIRNETEGAFDAFRQKAKQVKESRLSELQAWYDEEVAKMKTEFTQHESELQITLERATVEHKNHIEEQIKSKYNEEVVHLTEQLEMLKKEKKVYALQQGEQIQKSNLASDQKNNTSNEKANKEKEKEEEKKIEYLIDEAKVGTESEIEISKAKERAESEMQAQQREVLLKLSSEFSAQKEEIEKTFRSTCEQLEEEHANSVHAREVNIATATEKRRKELSDTIHNTEQQIIKLKETERESLATGAAQSQSLSLSNDTDVENNLTTTEEMEKHTAEAIHTVHAKFDDEKRKLCEVKETETKKLQEQLSKLRKEEQEEVQKEQLHTNENIYDDKVNSTAQEAPIDELKAKHTSELIRVEEMYKELRTKLEKSLQEELNVLKNKSCSSKSERTSALEKKAEAMTSESTTVNDDDDDDTTTVSGKQLIENALEADMQVYVSEVQQRRARAKELFDVQRSKLIAAHELQQIKEKRERMELTNTIVQERVEEELERERATAARAHAAAITRLQTQCAEEKKIIMSAIDEEINAFAQSKRIERGKNKKEKQGKEETTFNGTKNMRDDKLTVVSNNNDNKKTADEEELQRKLSELQLEKRLEQEKHLKELMLLTEKVQSTQNKLHNLQDALEKHRSEREQKKCMRQKEPKKDFKEIMEKENNEPQEHVNVKELEENLEQEQMKSLINDYKIKEMELKEQLMQWRNVNATLSEEIRHEIIERELNNLALENEDVSSDYDVGNIDNNALIAVNKLAQTPNLDANSKTLCTSAPFATRTPIATIAVSFSTSSLLRQTPLTSREAQWYCKAQLDHLSQRDTYLRELRNEYENNIQHLNSDKERDNSLTSSHYSSQSMSDSLRHVDEELLTVVDALNKRINTLTHSVRQLHSTHNEDDKDDVVAMHNMGNEIGEIDDK